MTESWRSWKKGNVGGLVDVTTRRKTLGMPESLVRSEKMAMSKEPEKTATLEELEKPVTMRDLVDAGGTTGGLEELAEKILWCSGVSGPQICVTSQHSGTSDSPSFQPHEHNSDFRLHRDICLSRQSVH